MGIRKRRADLAQGVTERNRVSGLDPPNHTSGVRILSLWPMKKPDLKALKGGLLPRNFDSPWSGLHGLDLKIQGPDTAGALLFGSI